jgi:hypothetical protein
MSTRTFRKVSCPTLQQGACHTASEVDSRRQPGARRFFRTRETIRGDAVAEHQLDVTPP